MRLGDRGETVDNLQEVLMSCGYLQEKQEFFNPIVRLAVNKVYRKLGRPETGEVVDFLEFANLCYSSIIMPVAEQNTATASKFNNYSDKHKNNDFRKGTASIPMEYIACYVINLNTGRIIDFELPPQEFTDNNTANFEDQFTLGRSGPFKGYSNSGPRTLDFTVSLHADYCRKGIVQTVDSLQALCYPTYDNRISAPQCMLVIGTFLKVKVVPQSVSVTWKGPYRDGIYTMADVSLSFSEVVDSSVSSTTIETGGFR